MTRLTQREIAEIRRSRPLSLSEEVENAMLRARRERAKFMAKTLRKLWNVSGFGAVVCGLQRGFASWRTLARLSDLDDAILQDIGLKRSEIQRVAIESSRKSHPYPASWLTSLKSELRRAAARRHTIAELSSLDDRILRDIGIERGTIEEVVTAQLEGRDPTWTLEETNATAEPGLATKLGVAIILPFYLLVQSAANSNTAIERKAA